ncbi:RNA polymerase Rpc34 subunit-domain-containing protein [Schizophyllum commune]
MSARKANDLEKKLHKAALKAHNKELSVEDVAEIIPDNKARTDALNFLLKVGLFKSLKNEKGKVSFRAVTKEEITVTKDLTAEEGLVLSHIKASKNEGIWTKHLKAKTNLAQALIDKCLKVLTQKKLIKRVQSVQHPTRKIYMLEGVEPSVALTGGPWYTDNELDVAFINTLIRACLKIVRDMSSPRQSADKQGALFPVGYQPEYPTAQKIRSALQRAHLTDTDLSEEHVESLLNVLILDGEIERIPVGISVPRHDDAESSEEEVERSQKKKRKRRSDSEERPSKKRRSKAIYTSDESESEDSEDERRKKRKRSKSKSKSRGHDSDSESEHETSSKKKSKKNGKKRQLSDSEDDDSEIERVVGKKKKKKTRRSRSSDSEDSDSEDEDEERRRKEKEKDKQKRKRKLDRSPSPDLLLGVDLGESEGVYAYRAVRQEQLSLGWSQAPCSICPSFQFCKEGGPVNPTECVYYTDWLAQANVQAVDEGEQA